MEHFADVRSGGVYVQEVHTLHVPRIAGRQILNIRALEVAPGVGVVVLEWVRTAVLVARHNQTSSRPAALLALVLCCRWNYFSVKLDVHNHVVAGYSCDHYEPCRAAPAPFVLQPPALVSPSLHMSRPSRACHHTHFWNR